ncbi:unnamed protein product [Caenorhabditis nigoni]
MIFHRILLLILLGLSLLKSDPISISLKVRCQFNVKWCANLTVFEEDNYHATHDYLDQSHTDLDKESFCTTDPFKEFHYGPRNLDGDVTPHYEFSALLYHNCTQGRIPSIWRCYSPDTLATCPVEGEHTVSMDVNIGNKGDSLECWRVQG